MSPWRSRSTVVTGVFGLGLSVALGAVSEGCNAIAGTGDLHVVTCVGDCDAGSTLVLQKPVPIYAHGIDKVDLLFVVDNSSSMVDKQLELARGIPALVRGLVDPTDTGGASPQPVLDLHVGVITTSLGSHGTSACDPALSTPENDDRGHLLPRSATASGVGYYLEHGSKVPSYGACQTAVAASALGWVFTNDRDPAAGYVGANMAAPLEIAASCIVLSARETGCGYEETWEALYHFLIDPTPYAKASATCTAGAAGDDCGSSSIEVSGVDDELLAQRKSFLRPDSLLAVVVLSDENDASLKPASKNWLPWAMRAQGMLHGFAACAGVPDDFEPETASEYTKLHDVFGCRSCFEDSSDSNCAKDWSGDDHDDRSLRAFAMTQRFGYNFLWSRQRYVDGFLSPEVPGRDAGGVTYPMTNPIYAGGLRSAELVVVAGIVGVPPGLVQTSSGAPKVLDENGWAKLISPDHAIRDPHMIESIVPRKGLVVYAGDRTRDLVNGGDRLLTTPDLQFACIAPRLDPAASFACADVAASASNPLCADAIQTHYGAYPGLRHLRILHDLGAIGVVSSICAPDFGPIVSAIGARVAETLQARCFRVPLSVDSTGNLDAVVYEVFKDETVDGLSRCDFISNGYCTPGGEPCRRPSGPGAPPATPAAATSTMEFLLPYVDAEGHVGESTARALVENGSVYVKDGAGHRRLVCEVKQLAGERVPPAQATACANALDYSPSAVAGGGFCYTTNPSLFAAGCASATGSLRFVGNAKTQVGSDVFISLRR